MSITNQILSTKLQRPNLPSDFIYRQKVINYVNDYAERPLTLVSAGAGFGKSTFVSSWLQEMPHKNAWVSLNDNDNDLRVFLQYFIASIQREVADFGENIMILLDAPEIPPLEILSSSLINELNDLPQLFVLALDDFHFIHNQDIFQLLSLLLKYPPENFHLVLITRRDPPLPLVSLRAKNKIKDVRAAHLQVTKSEIRALLEKHLQLKNVDEAVEKLENELDGWITGLRLAILHLSFHEYENGEVENILNDKNLGEEYLLEEIFWHLDDLTREFLLKTSILEKFSPSLSAYILSDSGNKINTEKIIRSLIKRNLFVINMDEQNIWYRYHHLFQELLRKELKKKYTKETVQKLHEKAFEWYDSHDLVEGAFCHALKIHNLDKLGSLIEKHIYKLVNKDKWYILDRWLHSLPEDFIRQSPALLAAKMWGLKDKMLIWEIPELLQEYEKIFRNVEVDELLKAKIQFFKAIVYFWSSDIKQINESYRLFAALMDNLSDEDEGFKGVVAVYYIIAAQIRGKKKELIRQYEKLIFSEKLNPLHKGLLLGGIVFAELRSANLDIALEYIRQLEDISRKYNNAYTATWADYFYGYVYFQQNKMEKAERYFEKALTNVYMLNTISFVDCFAGLLLTQQQFKKTENMKKTMHYMVEAVNARNNGVYSAYVYSIKARLSFLNDDLSAAEKYMQMADLKFDSGNVNFPLEIPRITECKLLLAHNTAEKTEEALRKLKQHISFAEQTNNISLLIDSLILKAVALKKKGDLEQALNVLSEAVNAGKPGCWIRPFIESGDEIYDLLDRIETDPPHEKYKKRIQQQLSEYLHSKTKSTAALTKQKKMVSYGIENLTNRELDILELLAQRLSNQEIADRLFISPATVKRHAVTIYHKLDVNSRRQAVQKALQLGVIQADGSKNYPSV